MSPLIKTCPQCDKPWETKIASKVGKSTFVTGVCGHLFNVKLLWEKSESIKEEQPKVTSELFVKEYLTSVYDEWVSLQEKKIIPDELNEKKAESFISIDSKRPFKFQCEATRLAEKANFNCLFEYQMGLGKTPITDITLALHKEKLLPALIVCKGSITWQHFKEAIRWNGGKVAEKEQKPLEWTAQVISDSATEIFPFFQLYITSYDMLRRLDVEDLRKLNLKTVVLDECQKISNTKSKRSQALREMLDELEIKHVIALSGTPIKNAPIEFYNILNILDPNTFYSKKNFESQWVDYRWDKTKGKHVPLGIRNLEEFHKITSSYVFRLTREEVKEQIGLSVTEPFRDFKFIDIDTDLKKAYSKTEDEFSSFFVQHELEGSKYSFADYSHILALFARMRHLAGLSKISWAEDFVSEWLASRCLTVEELTAGKTIKPKLAIFTHHVDVAKFLMNCIANICELENYNWKPLYLPSGLDSEKQDDIQNEFNFGPSRILVASTLGSGEGINLQHNCHDAVMMERQWNPANEEQAESRFIRIGQEADLVTVTYPTVLGTIDEYFMELVEKKRHMLKEIKSGKAQQNMWDETEVVTSLAKAIIAKRQGKRWSY